MTTPMNINVTASDSHATAIGGSDAARKVAAASRLTAAASAGVLAIGFACSLLGAWRIREGVHFSGQARFERVAGQVKDDVRHRLDTVRDALYGVQGLFRASKNLEREGFRNYFASRKISNNFADAFGFGYVERVPRSKMSDFADAQRAGGNQDFAVRTGGDHPELYVVKFTEPLDVDRLEVGLDYAADPVRRAALEESMLSGEPTLTGRVSLSQDVLQRPSFVYFLPIYRSDTNPLTPQERQRDLVGWVFAPMVMEKAMAAVAKGATSRIDLEVYDGNVTTRETVVFDADGAPHAVPDAAPQDAENLRMFHERTSVSIGGREWTLWIGSTPEFDAEVSSYMPIFMGICGGLVSILLALVVWEMGSGKARALSLAAHMTAGLRASELSARSALAKVSAYRAVLDQHAIIGVTDLAGTIIDANGPFCRISGYSRAELIGANHNILNSRCHSKMFWAQMWKVVANGGVWRAEVCNKAKDGTLYWVDTTIAPVRDAERKITGFIAVRLDITARKLGEGKLSKALEAAESANRAKSEFLANMSHEIRTPMTAILGFTDLLSDDSSSVLSPAQRAETINTIRSAGQHLLTVINDILDVSKIESGKMIIERIDASLVQLLVEVESLVRPRAIAKGLSINLRLDSPLPERAFTDPTRLRQILLNLAGNAVKFTQSGDISIAIRIKDLGRLTRLIIDVEDTGPGLTSEQAGRIFDTFAQADSTTTRRFGGSGLGLTISRCLARLMGGDVTLVRTQPGYGSCFRIELPLEIAADCRMIPCLNAVVPDRLPNCSGTPANLSGRILLAEDGPDNQRLIAFHLRKAGAEVTVADNGRIALELLDKADTDKTPFDLLVSDMQMPEMDGYTLARILRDRGSKLPIVALTAHAMAEDRAKCLAAGCDDYSTKPIDKAVLLSTCAAWMGKTGGIKIMLAAA